MGLQAPDMIQNYNRYSYVLNNPMNATDPSGHNWFKKIIGIIIAIIIAVILVIVATYALSFLLGQLGTFSTFAANASVWLVPSCTTAPTFFGIQMSVGIAATVGATWAAVNTTIQGGSFKQTLKSAIIGAANGAVGAIVGGYMHGLGSDWGSYLAGGDNILGTAAHVGAHGVSGGAMAEASGGSFRDGFIGAVVGAGVDGLGYKVFGNTALYNSKDAWAVAGRTAISAVSGGIASVATGGKFADGAYSAAFFHLFNADLEFFYDTHEIGYVERVHNGLQLSDPDYAPWEGRDGFIARPEYDFITQTTSFHYPEGPNGEGGLQYAVAPWEMLGAGSRGASVGAAPKTINLTRIFWDTRQFKSVSAAYWKAQGGASGNHLHHWLIPQRMVKAYPFLKPFANSGLNLMVVPGRFNSWMGYSSVGRGVEIGIRLAVPTGVAGGAYGGAKWGQKVFEDY